MNSHAILLLLVAISLIPSITHAIFLQEIFNLLKTTSESLTNEVISSHKCLHGSHTYNGSCYFISNHRRIIPNYESTNTFLSIPIVKNSSHQFVVSSLILPTETTWFEANKYCQQISNDSYLIDFTNEHEYKELVKEIFNIRINNTLASKNLLKQEDYYIGLFLNKSINEWQWSNGDLLSETTHFLNKSIKIDMNDSVYRPCAYLYLRDNGQININNDNCDRNKKPYICKYVIDRCFNNTKCGSNGNCINLPYAKTYSCKCRIFYEGKYCDKWSVQGIQMLCLLGIVVGVLLGTVCVKVSYKIFKKYTNQKLIVVSLEKNTLLNNDLNDSHGSLYSLKMMNFECVKRYGKYFTIITTSLFISIALLFSTYYAKSWSLRNLIKNLPDSFANNYCHLIEDDFIDDYVLIIITLPMAIFMYAYNIVCLSIDDHSFSCKSKKLKTKKDVFKNSRDNTDGNFVINEDFIQIDVVESNIVRRPSVSSNASKLSGKVTCLFTSLRRKLTLKRHELSRFMCSCRLELLAPINPLNQENRFISACIYAAFSYQIIKIFEHLLFGQSARNQLNEKINTLHDTLDMLKTASSSAFESPFSEISNHIENGILTDLLRQIFSVFVFGLRYYSLLICVESKQKSFICYSICTLYIWFLYSTYIYSNIFCLLPNVSAYLIMPNNTLNHTQLKMNHSFDVAYFNVEISKKNDTKPKMESQNLTNLIPIDKFNIIMYEKVLFYFIMTILAFYFTIETIYLAKQTAWSKCFQSRFDSVSTKLTNEYLYSMRLLNSHKTPQRQSFVAYLFEKYIYKCKYHFKYSKQLINTYVIAFMLLFYLTCIIIRKSSIIVSLFNQFILIFISLIYSKEENKNVYLFVDRAQMIFFNNITYYVILACVVTTVVYFMQLLLGIRAYQRHMLNAYKGIHDKSIISLRKSGTVSSVKYSLHYSGYMIGYLLWGYLILYLFILLLILLIKLLIKFKYISELVLKLLLPIACIYLFKRLLIWYLSRYLLVNKQSRSIKNYKLYFIFYHFNFFYDCFIGSFICLLRIMKSSLACLFFMPRLDYSIFGRLLELTDSGYLSYVSFVYLQSTLFNPIKITFIKLLTNTTHIMCASSMCGNRQQRNRIRNKWWLCITLVNNPILYKQRKSYLKKNKNKNLIKIDSLEKFLERSLKRLNLSSRFTSKSTLNGTLDSKSSLNTLDTIESTKKTHIQCLVKNISRVN